jgi:hypothetical protein
MRAIFLALAAWSLAGAVHAEQAEAKPAWSGVWQGTLGDNQIRVCVGVAGDADGGAYYYMRHLKFIPLEADKGGGWTEGYDDDKKAPHWTLAAAGRDALTGTWSGGGKSFPIRLSRVAVGKNVEDVPCGALAFTAPRITPTTLTRKAGVRDGVPYTTLTLHLGAQLDASLETFALNATTPAATRINAELAKPLSSKDDDGQPDYVACLISAAAAHGDGGFHRTISPELIAKHWMVSTESDEDDCGGVHPNHGVGWRIWNLTTGAAIDPWTWFNSEGVIHPKEVPDAAEAGPRLRKMLDARWTHHGECKDALQGFDDFWDVHFTRAGVAFTPELAHVDQGCTEDIVLKFNELAPLLNAKGRSDIASIVADLKILPPPAKSRKL